ncbi:pantoate--beta-alanine ligase [Pleomorphovibrio marinus]|uniref:pantoate--beta-alanine ligase n=1 Tax=Pleomorphovibrio marinus TaxID=2164132 RepID=UPI000E0B69F1|nr:pantoate--beta-alanine ligase [Pleomorphovibrio marinus]
MKIVKEIEALKSVLNHVRGTFPSIGLVPTMGALHQGHLALIRAAKSQSDYVVVSIFVNPIQFNQVKDFENYPNTLEFDLELLKKEMVDLVFIPSTKEIYPKQVGLSLSFPNFDNMLEGKFRPGHFNGVGIVVAKLLHLVQPDLAFFGQKDLQQAYVINLLVEGLSFGVKIVVVPTVREEDGLAFSSRNLRLGLAERKIAPKLYETLSLAKKRLLHKKTWQEVKRTLTKELEGIDSLKLEYFELVRLPDFVIVQHCAADAEFALCIAAHLGDIRLIDNEIIGFHPE